MCYATRPLSPKQNKLFRKYFQQDSKADSTILSHSVSRGGRKQTGFKVAKAFNREKHENVTQGFILGPMLFWD